MDVPFYPPERYPTAEDIRKNPVKKRENIPVYIDEFLDYDLRRSLQVMIEHIPRLQQALLCPEWKKTALLFHRTTMDVRRMDIEMKCLLCQVQYCYYELTEEERQLLRQISPEYKARDDRRISDNLQRVLPPPPVYHFSQTASAIEGATQMIFPTLQNSPPPYTPSLPVDQFGVAGLAPLEQPSELESVIDEGTTEDPDHLDRVDTVV
ncbi:hypothetical protein VKT23_009083 [Stygiomarasmius scandens]|uniref:Uncharacterized protein n=1 Tax=Marasmiellus scandens TaxID=2682957 RepID=A0ABR1JLQ1_9AGAR